MFSLEKNQLIINKSGNKCDLPSINSKNNKIKKTNSPSLKLSFWNIIEL